MRTILSSMLFIAIVCVAWAQAVNSQLEYRGVAIEVPGYHAWGTSPVRGEVESVRLFNLKNDIGEQNDLTNTHPDMVSQMRSRLHMLCRDVDSKFLQKKDDGPDPWRPPYLLNTRN